MEFKDISKKDNSLLHRTEVSAVVCFKGSTPSNVDVKNALSAQIGVDEKLGIVKHIYTRFGETCADVLLFVYDSKDNLKKVERIKELPEEKAAKEAAAKAAEEKKAEAEKPAEEKKEEAPKAEEKVEEKKKEEKKEEKPAEEKKEAPKAEEKPVEEKKE